MNAQQVGKSVLKFASDHSPEILTGLAVIGVVTTAIFAGDAKTKADYLIMESGAETPKEKIQVAWKCYIPTAAVGCATIGCIIGATSINLRRNAALTAAYSLTETFAKEYKEKVVDILGEEKDKEIRDEIAKDRVKANPPSERVVIVNDSDDHICYDSISGRYFRSTVDKLKRAQNNLNSRALEDMYVSMNDFYYEIGIPGVKIGDMLGWGPMNLIDLVFTSTILEDGTPCICVDFREQPSADPC